MLRNTLAYTGPLAGSAVMLLGGYLSFAILFVSATLLLFALLRKR